MKPKGSKKIYRVQIQQVLSVDCPSVPAVRAVQGMPERFSTSLPSGTRRVLWSTALLSDNTAFTSAIGQ